MTNIKCMFYIISAILLFIYYQKNIPEFINNHKDGELGSLTFEIVYWHNKNLDDVIGNDEAKDDISDILDMIKYPEKYINMHFISNTAQICVFWLHTFCGRSKQGWFWL